jgi:hypothetical protein
MARPLRLQFAGAIYHVTSRGNARGKVFFTDADPRVVSAHAVERRQPAAVRRVRLAARSKVQMFKS